MSLAGCYAGSMSMDWKHKRVLVTGGTGFIGSFLVEALLERGAKVRVPMRSKNYRDLSERRAEIEWMEGDLRDSAYCEALVKDVDHVFHLAAHRRNGDFHRKRCGDVMAGNVQMTLALIDALRDTPDVGVTFFSTANVPSSCDVISLAQREDLDGYVLGKAVCETLWFACAKQRGFPLLIIRAVGAYGPRDTFSKDANVIPSLLVRASKSKDALTVWGSGDQERGFLFVRDLIAATFALHDAGARGIQYVVPPDVVAMRVLAKKIRDTVKPELQLRFDTSKPEGTRSLPRLPKHDALRSFSWTPLEEGLAQTVAWWQGERYS